MKEISIHVGKRIRLYRKMKGITIEVFAEMIGKSKATVSKYENGDISIDIETLFGIAKNLGVSVNQLVDYEDVTIPEAAEESGRPLLGLRTKYYMYYFDGRRGRISKGIIETKGEEKDNECPADFYGDVESFDNYHNCKFLCSGGMKRFDTFTIFHFRNMNNRVEEIFIYGINSFIHKDWTMGMASGLSTQPIMPASFKVVISSNIMEENDELRELLSINRDDMRQMKKMNMFVINQNT